MALTCSRIQGRRLLPSLLCRKTLGAVGASSTTMPVTPAKPEGWQLRAHLLNSAVPMVAFGFMDNTVMLHAGNAIDATLGVTFGLSTLAAAACGQVCSDMAGVTFGGVIEALAAKVGLPAAHLTEEQLSSGTVKRVGLMGSLLGVFSGCSLGLLNLFIIDTDRTRELKLAAESEACGFSVEISNAVRPGCTAITIEGPQGVKGVIASVTNVMASEGILIRDMSGHRDSEATGTLTLTFYVTKDGEEVEDDDLKSLGRSIMAACNDPQFHQKLEKKMVSELEELKTQLARAQEALETALKDKETAEKIMEKYYLRVTGKNGETPESHQSSTTSA
ncbi:tmem65 [Symbiodinium sp. CCMP2592]|nr:tmem65 [Symbiodinium sp. CCMP2592]